jgi:uncharacterized protein YaeQ
MTETEKHWTKTAQKVLEGRKIINVRYLDDEEMEMMGWYKRPIVFQLDNGELCVLSADDEGNDGGALFYGRNGVIPTLR